MTIEVITGGPLSAPDVSLEFIVLKNLCLTVASADHHLNTYNPNVQVPFYMFQINYYSFCHT